MRSGHRRDHRASTTRACTAAPGWPTGAGHVADGSIRCPYHALALRARRPAASRSSTPTSSHGSPTTSRSAGAGRALGRVRVRQPRPRRGAAARLPRPAARRCSRRTTSTRCGSARTSPRLPANWKAVVDAFNESYHVQGTHRADPAVDRRREHRVRAARQRTRTTAGCPARAASCGRARASGSRADEYDEGEILARRSSPGSAARSSATSARSSTSCARQARRPGRRCSRAYQDAPHGRCSRRAASTSRASTPDQMTSADDVFCFPNVVGPDLSRERDPVPRAARTVSIPTARSRTPGCSSGRDPDRTWPMPERRLLRRLARARLGRDHRRRTTRTWSGCRPG